MTPVGGPTPGAAQEEPVHERADCLGVPCGTAGQELVEPGADAFQVLCAFG